MDRESPVVRAIRETLELANVPAWHAGGAVFDALGAWGKHELTSSEDILRFVHGVLADSLSKRLGPIDAKQAIERVDALLRDTSAPGSRGKSTIIEKTSILPPEEASDPKMKVLPESQLPRTSTPAAQVPNGARGLRIPPPPRRLESDPPPRDPHPTFEETELDTTSADARPPSAPVEGDRTNDDLAPVVVPQDQLPADLRAQDAEDAFRRDSGEVFESLGGKAAPINPRLHIDRPIVKAPLRPRKGSDVLQLEPDETTQGLMLDAPELIVEPLTSSLPPNERAALELEYSGNSTVPPVSSDSVDVDVDVEMPTGAELPHDRATILVRTHAAQVPVVVVGASDRFSIRMRSVLGRNVASLRTVGTPDDVRVAIAASPFVVIVDATDFAPIEPEELAQIMMAARGDTVHAIWGIDMPYGRSLAAQFNLAGATYVGLTKRDGLDPLLDLVRSRRG